VTVVFGAVAAAAVLELERDEGETKPALCVGGALLAVTVALATVA
jgi:hypothetical protein